MSVEFNEEETIVTARPKPQKLSLLTRLVYAFKLAKTEADAQRVILIAAICCFVAALFVFLSLGGIL